MLWWCVMGVRCLEVQCCASVAVAVLCCDAVRVITHNSVTQHHTTASHTSATAPAAHLTASHTTASCTHKCHSTTHRTSQRHTAAHSFPHHSQTPSTTPSHNKRFQKIQQNFALLSTDRKTVTPLPPMNALNRTNVVEMIFQESSSRHSRKGH